MRKIKELTDKEKIDFMFIYKAQNAFSIKNFTAKKLVKYINFLEHYTLELSNGDKKEKHHSKEEIVNSLYALFLS